MLSLELVDDRAEKTPAPAKAGLVQKAAYAAGAMVRASGQNIIISSPLVPSEDDGAIILAALDAGLSSL